MSGSVGPHQPAVPAHGFGWLPGTRAGKAVLAAFPVWILPSWYLVTFLSGAGGMFESPRAIAANSLFQAAVAAVGLTANLAVLVLARDRSLALVLAAVVLAAVLAYMGWYASTFGVPGT